MPFMDNFDYIQIVPIVTVALIIIGGLAALFIKPKDFQNSRTFVFISVMASIAVVILACNVFLTTMNLEIQREVTVADFTKRAIDKLWLYPNQVLTEQKHIRPEFLASFFYSNLTLYNMTKDLHTKATVDSQIEEQYIAMIMMQCWEDYLTLRIFDKTGDDAWLNSFIAWAQSPYLKEQVNFLKHNYASTTVRLSDLLFEYAAQLPVPTPDSAYQPLINRLLMDPRLLRVYVDRNLATK